MGTAIQGAQIYVLNQPTLNTSTVPPAPLASIYSSQSAAQALQQPVLADGMGHFYFYASSGFYTIVVAYQGIIQRVYADQLLGGGSLGLTGAIQGNNNGLFGSIPGSVADFVNGPITLAPVGPGIALALQSLNGVTLKVKGDSHGSDLVDWFAQQTSSPPDVYITGNGSLGLSNFLYDSTGSAGTLGQVLSPTVTGTAWSSAVRTASINFMLDGGGLLLTTGVKGQIEIPIACTITGWVLTADQSGSAVVDVLTSTYAGFPSTSSICSGGGGDKPTLSSVQKNENLAVSGSVWTTAVAANTILQVNLNSVTTCQRLNLTLIVTITTG